MAITRNRNKFRQPMNTNCLSAFWFMNLQEIRYVQQNEKVPKSSRLKYAFPDAGRGVDSVRVSSFFPLSFWLVEKMLLCHRILSQLLTLKFAWSFVEYHQLNSTIRPQVSSLFVSKLFEPLERPDKAGESSSLVHCSFFVGRGP
jgi:hypothetical protein